MTATGRSSLDCAVATDRCSGTGSGEERLLDEGTVPAPGMTARAPVTQIGGGQDVQPRLGIGVAGGTGGEGIAMGILNLLAAGVVDRQPGMVRLVDRPGGH